VRGPLLAATLALAVTNVRAHQLDEFVQATRIDFAARPLAIELSLAPGVIVAPQIIALVDRNTDGVLEPSEVEAYAATVIQALTLTVDGVPVHLTVKDAQSPPADTLLEGSDAIRIRAVASAPLSGGRHHVVFENGYAPIASVYSVNALQPPDATVSLTLPSRDPQQRSFAIDVNVTRLGLAWHWAVLGFVIAVLVAIRWRNGARTATVACLTYSCLSGCFSLPQSVGWARAAPALPENVA
jgi:hypothetical protein